MASVLLQVIEQALATEPVVQREKVRMVSREDFIRDALTAFEKVLPESFSEKDAIKKMGRLVEALRYESAPTINLDSEVTSEGEEHLGDIPDRPELSKLNDENLKTLIDNIYGGKPRGRWNDDTRSKWLDKLNRERDTFLAA